jgi:hypothetical protein
MVNRPAIVYFLFSCYIPYSKIKLKIKKRNKEKEEKKKKIIGGHTRWLL